MCESWARQEKRGIREDASSGNLSRAICRIWSYSDVLDARGAEPRGYRRLSPRSFRFFFPLLCRGTRGESVICVGSMGDFFTVAYSHPGFDSKLRSRV